MIEVTVKENDQVMNFKNNLGCLFITNQGKENILFSSDDVESVTGKTKMDFLLRQLLVENLKQHFMERCKDLGIDSSTVSGQDIEYLIDYGKSTIDHYLDEVDNLLIHSYGGRRG